MKNELTAKLTERYDLELLNLLTEDLKSSRLGVSKILSNVTFNKDQFFIAS